MVSCRDPNRFSALLQEVPGSKPVLRHCVPFATRCLASSAALRHHRAMAKLHFHYSTMNAGKSTLLLQAAHNYHERGMSVFRMTAALDDRAGQGRIGSRIGFAREAEM